MAPADKRIFFGLEACAPWPHPLPSGRLLDEQHRHATLAFLGKINWPEFDARLSQVPAPPFRLGIAGIFDKVLFLPKRHPHVACWHVELFEGKEIIETYQKQLIDWLCSINFSPAHHAEEKWLPHVTLARSPFNLNRWRSDFKPLPVVFNRLNLYESLGKSQYAILHSWPFELPWKEIEHTADIAFEIRGENIRQILWHAQMALAFKFPELLNYFLDVNQKNGSPETLDDVIIQLNQAVAEADQGEGCRLKAISLHGDLIEFHHLLIWEMIVDV